MRLALLLLTASLSSSLLARTWTSKEGATFDAELTEVSADQATLSSPQLKNPLTIPISELSADDQAFISSWLDKQKQESAKLAKMHPYQRRQYELKKATADIADNFKDEWPGLVSAADDIEVVDASDPEFDGRYIYHSPHYEFICDVELKSHLVKRFAVLFEASREYCRTLPISTKKAHVAGTKHRNRIFLFETMASYAKNGGPPGSAGVYMSGEDIVMVPLTSLGVKKLGSSYSIDYKAGNKTLPHELTHQLTDHEYYRSGARGWFSEGLAEYVAVTPYRSGSFNVKKALNAVRDYATEYGRDDNGGRALGDNINAPDLKKYMLQSYGSFTANGNFNYGLGLLITTYFFHMDGDGDRAAINAFLQALREGKQGDAALEALRKGRTWDELEDAISRGWRSRGVTINFN